MRAFQPGSSSEWASYGFTVVSTIYAVLSAPVCRGVGRPASPQESTSGSSAKPHGVHVTTDESFAGEPVEADITGMQSALDRSLAAWLAYLKAAAESKG
jgi:hypothetical protein